MLAVLLLLAPHEQSGFRTTRGQRIERSLMCAFIEKFWQCFLLRTTNVHWFAIDDLSNVRGRIIHVPNQDRLGGTDDHAGRLQSHVYAVRAKVALLSRMIFRIDKDCVVRTGGHAGFAADANRLVEVDYAVGALEHRRRRTGRDARRMRTLITAGHLVRAAHLWKNAYAYVDVLDIGPRDADGHDVFRLARRRARMTADTASVVDDLGPLDWRVSSWLWLDHTFRFETGKNISRT